MQGGARASRSAARHDGLSAAIDNEVLQFFVILALLIPLTVAGPARVGGWDGLVQRVAAAGDPEQLSSWPGTTLTQIENPVLPVVGWSR